MRISPTPVPLPTTEVRSASSMRSDVEAAAAAVSTPASAVASGDGIERYDFHRISPKDLLATINRLIVSGQMDLDETSPLVGIIPNPAAGLQLNMTSPTAFTDPIDVYARLQQGIDFARYNDDDSGERFFQSAIDALQRFQGRPVAIDLTA